jgi:iron complex transport system ATP-binding protein
MLELAGVTFAYGVAGVPGARPVLRDVSLAIARREIVGIVGQSGSGKSTLLRVCAGLLAPAAGTVRVAGVDPRRTRRAELARRVAYLPQEHALGFPFTVAEVVLMGRYPHRRALSLESADDLAAAEDAMRRCDVHELAGRRFHELSGGERRRALLAQAFCQAAELVLLDEPTVSLDPAHAIAVFAALEAARRERDASIVVVTHDLNLAARFCDRVLLVDAGTIAADAAPRELFTSPAAARAFGVDLHVGALPSGQPFVVPA